MVGMPRLRQLRIKPGMRGERECELYYEQSQVRGGGSRILSYGQNQVRGREAWYIRLRTKPGVNSIKKFKCTLQVGPLFSQIHTNLDPLKVFYKFPLEASNLYLQWYSIGFNQV